MLFLGKKLESKEAAAEYNKKIYQDREVGGQYQRGCIGSLACENCFYIVSDQVCLCAGFFICPNCGVEHGKKIQFISTTLTPVPITNYFPNLHPKEKFSEIVEKVFNDVVVWNDATSEISRELKENLIKEINKL